MSNLNGFKIVSESINQHCILVTGLSGSGKTTIATKLGKQKGYEIISIDNEAKKEFRKKYKHSLLELEKELDIHKLMNLVNEYQFKAFKKLFTKYKNTNVIIEGTIIMFKQCWPYIDNSKTELVLIKAPSKSEIFKRRIKRSVKKRRSKGLPKYSKEELEQKKRSNDILYNTHLVIYNKFFTRYKNRITLVLN